MYQLFQGLCCFFKQRSRLCAAVGILLPCTHIYAQDCHVAMRGHVIHADDGIPLAYASVRISNEAKSASTDEQGYFMIPNLCEGENYTVEISHVECAHMTQVVQLKERSTLEFRLQHNTTIATVLITEQAIRPDVAQSASSMQGIELEARRGLGLGESIRQLPGVTTLNVGANVSKPVIQGLHSNRIAIVNNNVTLESQQWGSDHAPEIDPFGAGQITVIKGAAGVRYGAGAMGGAVILEPASLRKTLGIGGWLVTGVFSNGIGGNLAGALDIRPNRHPNFAMRVQATAKRSGNLRASDYWLGNTGMAELNGSVLAELKSRHWIHTWSASRFDQSFGVLRASHLGSVDQVQAAIASDQPLNNTNWFTYFIDRPKQRAQHYVAQYKAVRSFSEWWKMSLQYSTQYNYRREYDRGRSSVTAGNQAQIAFQLWSNTLDIQVEHEPIHHWKGSAGIQAIQQINQVSRGGFIPDYSSFGGSIWAIERWRRFPSKWEVEFGARYDYRWTHATTIGNGNRNLNQNLQFGNVSGTAGLIYHIDPYRSIVFNSGYAWRPPAVNELFARGIHQGAGIFEEGDTSLTSEKAWNTNLTFRWRPRKSEAFSGELSVYHNAIRDFIYLEPQNVVRVTVRGNFPAYQYRQDDVVLQGLDASANWPLGRGLYVATRASLLRAYRMVSNANEPGEHRDWLPLIPSDRYQYGLGWAGNPATNDHEPRTTCKILFNTVLRQTRIPEIELLKAPPNAFTTVSLDATRKLRFRRSKSKDYPLELGVSVQNLTNARYREYLNFFRFYTDEMGINIGVRLKWTF